MKKTLIIDGNNLIHRTFWMARSQCERKPELDLPNLHIYFTLNAIFSYVNKYKPSKTICVWDEKPDYQVNARKAQFEGYKGNRSKDNAPYENNTPVKEILSYMGIPSIFPRELEADDIVAHLCNTLDGYKVIVSVDKDFLQLVDKNTILFDPIRKIEFTAAEFEAQTGYTREDWLIAKCLQGDKSDNVPGIKGFGKVTIQKYLNGDISLTQEQQEVFNKNHELFTLDKINNHENEVDYYEEQLQVVHTPDWLAFQSACRDRDFSRILNNEQTWYSLFFAQHRLQSLLE